MSSFNTYVSCLGNWRVDRAIDTAAAQAVIGCSFGRRDDGTNCPSNVAIARRVGDVCIELGIPCCVQGEVARHIEHLQEMYVSRESSNVHCEGYIGTRQTIEELFYNYLLPKKFFRVVVVAHRHHAWRVIRVCEKFGLEVVGVVTKGVPYDRRSSQRWCRTAWNPLRTIWKWPPDPPFIPYEVAARWVYLKKGWI